MKNLILQHSSWVKKYLTRHYPLPLEVIDRHTETIDWDLLSQNTNIAWSLEFCERHENRIRWEKLNPMESTSLKGKEKFTELIRFLDRYKGLLNWEIVCERLFEPADQIKFQR